MSDKYRELTDKVLNDEIDPLEGLTELTEMISEDVYQIRIKEFTDYIRDMLDGRRFADLTPFELQELAGHAYAEYWGMFGEEGSESHAKKFFMDCKLSIGV